jgi:hypothetical protein
MELGPKDRVLIRCQVCNKQAALPNMADYRQWMTLHQRTNKLHNAFW